MTDCKLSIDYIKTKVNDAVNKYNSAPGYDYRIKSVMLFGSYASGHATPESDVDLLVTFEQDHSSLYAIGKAYNLFEEALKTEVDVVAEPIPEDSFLEIEKVVPLYAA